MRLLDNIRRYTSIGSGVALVGVSLWSAYFNAMAGRSFAGVLAFVSGLSALGIGLVLQNAIARRLTAALCVCLAIIFVVGRINPFAAMDDPNPAEITTLLAWIVPTDVGLLLMASLIDPPRRRTGEKT